MWVVGWSECGASWRPGRTKRVHVHRQGVCVVVLDVVVDDDDDDDDDDVVVDDDDDDDDDDFAVALW